MEINSTGIKKSELKDYLSFWTTKLREKFGNNFVIKKEGVVDNLATASSMTNMLQEDVVMYLAKQMNPYTCEGEFQDAQYSLIGLTRRYADYTVTQRTISGIAGTVCPVGSILFKNDSTDDQFKLNSEVTIGENGTAKGSFTAIELGGIPLEPEETLTIIDAPGGITGVYYSVGDLTNIGDDYEDDSEFRARWLQVQSLANSATDGGIKKYLLPLVDSDKNLNIIDNKSDVEVNGTPAHTLQVIIYSAESDETIAQTIFDHLTDGLELYGTTNVVIEDSSGTEENIKFTRATALPIYFNIDLVIEDNQIWTEIERQVKDIIVSNFKPNMAEKIVANDYIALINEIEGVDYVSDIKVNSDGGSTWANVQQVAINEIAQVVVDNITVTEVSA